MVSRNYRKGRTESIKYIVNKYHGNLTITNKNDLFNVDIIIPIKGKN